MAKGYRGGRSELVIIPAIPLLRDRLVIIKAEERRIRILIRAAVELAKVKARTVEQEGDHAESKSC